jgi:hypothetical protein
MNGGGVCGGVCTLGKVGHQTTYGGSLDAETCRVQVVPLPSDFCIH